MDIIRFWNCSHRFLPELWLNGLALSITIDSCVSGFLFFTASMASAGYFVGWINLCDLFADATHAERPHSCNNHVDVKAPRTFQQRCHQSL